MVDIKAFVNYSSRRDVGITPYKSYRSVIAGIEAVGAKRRTDS